MEQGIGTGGVFDSGPKLEQRISQLDATLTDTEINAPTYLEWPDATLARAVRELAHDLSNPMGDDSIQAEAAAMVLIGLLRTQKGAGTIEIKLKMAEGPLFRVTIQEMEPEPTDPRETLAMLDAGKEDVEQYYAKLDETLAALKEAVGVGGYFQAEDGIVYKLVEPEGHFVKYRKLSYVRTKREGERAGTLSKKEADEWLALKGKLEALKGASLQWVDSAPVDQDAAVVG